jgi:hypothetical protein
MTPFLGSGLGGGAGEVAGGAGSTSSTGASLVGTAASSAGGLGVAVGVTVVESVAGGAEVVVVGSSTVSGTAVESGFGWSAGGKGAGASVDDGGDAGGIELVVTGIVGAGVAWTPPATPTVTATAVTTRTRLRRTRLLRFIAALFLFIGSPSGTPATSTMTNRRPDRMSSRYST